MFETEFMGRHAELQLLDNLWKAPKATLLILYGRRRVGKTRLLTHWLQQHSEHAIYWVAEPTAALDQLRSFSQALYNFATPDAPAPPDFTYSNWEQALRQAAQLAQTRRVALFIDEVTYLTDVNPNIVGTLQKAWDQWLSKSNIFMALSGSQMGMMQQMISYDAPLYGRATAQLKLPPIPFGVTSQFFPRYNAHDRVATYAIWGGIPAYWERMDETLSVIDNVRVQLLPSNSWMQEEPRLLLQDFITDPHNYVGIMRAIAFGAHAQNEICERTGLSKGLVSKYLIVLRGTGFVERRVPATETNPDSRRGRYYVTDPFLRFYYRFMAAYQARLAMGEQQKLLEAIEQNLPEFILHNTWEELCHEWLLRASARGEFPVEIEEVGGAWTRTQTFGVVGINRQERILVLGGCHWKDEPLGTQVIHDLVSRTTAILPDEEVWQVYYLIFASNGWLPEVLNSSEHMAHHLSVGKRWVVIGLQLLDLEKVDSDLARWSIVNSE